MARTPRERLMFVKPSGKKEENLSGMIYDMVRQIPKGRVTSYGAIAKVLGLSNPRIVGRAMRSSDDDGVPVPAHRVVTSSGQLSHDSDSHRRKALEKEGVRLNGKKIVNFKKLFWDPVVEL